MDGPRRLQTGDHLARDADKGAPRRGALGARPLGSQEAGRRAPSRTSRSQTTQADVDRSAAITYHRVEHPHTRRHSHRRGQQGSHGCSTPVSLQTRRCKDRTTPGPSVQRQPQLEAVCRPLASGQHHLRPVDPRHIWLRAPPAPRQGSRLGRVPGQEGEDRVLRLRKRHDDAGSGRLYHTLALEIASDEASPSWKPSRIMGSRTWTKCALDITPYAKQMLRSTWSHTTLPSAQLPDPNHKRC